MQIRDFEIYTGRNFTTEQNEALMLKHIAPKVIVTERECMDRRWFDYRMMHPTSATLLFDHVYKDEYRKAYRRDIDAIRAKTAKMFRIDNLFARKASEITGMWKARQHADLLSCPYDIFIGTGLSWARNIGWDNYPRPAQMYSEDVLGAIMEYWTEYRSEVLVRPLRLEELGPEGDELPWRDDYQMWLADQISTRPGPLKFKLASALTMTQDLDEQVAREQFGNEAVDEALSCFDY